MLDESTLEKRDGNAEKNNIKILRIGIGMSKQKEAISKNKS